MQKDFGLSIIFFLLKHLYIQSQNSPTRRRRIIYKIKWTSFNIFLWTIFLHSIWLEKRQWNKSDLTVLNLEHFVIRLHVRQECPNWFTCSYRGIKEFISMRSTMPSDSMDDIELKNIQLQFPPLRCLSRDDSSVREERVETDKGSILVAVQGNRAKPAILTYHDLGLNCK